MDSEKLDEIVREVVTLALNDANTAPPIESLGSYGPVVIGALIVLMLVSVLGVFVLTYSYTTTKKDGRTKKGKIRKRAVQLLSVAVGLPALLILAMVGALGSEAVATLFGAFFGYILSGISDEDNDGEKGVNTV